MPKAGLNSFDWAFVQRSTFVPGLNFCAKNPTFDNVKNVVRHYKKPNRMINFFKKKQNREENNFDNFPPIGGLMVSKMVVDKNIKPRFMYREKRTRPEDSGWRIFTGFESEEYNDNPDNIGIYNPSTILKIDPSIEDLLLKGIGSVYEKTENDDWYKVTDFDLEDDFMTTHRITEDWTLKSIIFLSVPLNKMELYIIQPATNLLDLLSGIRKRISKNYMLIIVEILKTETRQNQKH